MNIKTLCSSASLILIYYLYSCSAIADQKVEDYFALSPAELAELPVSIATGTPTSIAQSAGVTSVVTAEQIKSMGATELHEVLETVAGVHATLQPNTSDYSYSIRGIRNAQNSEVLILLNGTRITTPFNGTLMTGTELPIEAIQQVEVIRGPGSALYGADAFAGVINIITKKAKDINGTNLGVRVGDHGNQSGWGQYGSKWSDWEVATSLQFQHTDGDHSRVLPADAQTLNDSRLGTHSSLAPGAMNTNYETLNAHLNLQRKHWDLGFWAFNSTGGVRAGAAGALDPNGFGKGAQYLGDARFSTEDWFDKWELQAHLSYRQTEFNSQLQIFPNNTTLYVGTNGNFSNPTQQVTFQNGVNNNLGRIERIPAIELISIYKGLTNHIMRIHAGFRYEEITTSDSRNFGYGQALPSIVTGNLVNVSGTAYAYLPNAHRTISSLVAQDEWQIVPNWQLTAGLRYDHYSDFGDTFNPRLALVWNINKEITSKLLYGRAFRAPNFSEQFTQNNPVILGNRNLNPETIHTYEWALTYQPTSSLSTAFNMYYYQINNQISALHNTSGATSTYENNGNQYGYGNEFEFNWQFAEQWSIKGNYAWQHAMDRSTHNEVTGVPEHHIYTALDWQFLPQWQLQPQLNWIGGRTNLTATAINLPGNNLNLDNYQTIDVTLRGKKLFTHVNVTASLRNALDNHYYEPTNLQAPATIPMLGRSFYLEAAINF